VVGHLRVPVRLEDPETSIGKRGSFLVRAAFPGLRWNAWVWEKV